MIKNNTVVVLIAHGSRISEANEEVRILGKKLQQRLKRDVIPCFLELDSPDIPTAIDLALEKPHQEILILPYFLVQGRHMKEDIPRIVAEKTKARPETKIRMLEYLGKQPSLLELLAELANKET